MVKVVNMRRGSGHHKVDDGMRRKRIVSLDYEGRCLVFHEYDGGDARGFISHDILLFLPFVSR